MTTPTLTPRAAREQTVFRTLLNAMARPGSVAQLDLNGSNPLVAIAEALVDHEVTFAAAPERQELVEAILRQTGSHVGSVDASEYVFCDAESLEHVLREATDGTWEYPDAGATVVCLVSAIADESMLDGEGVLTPQPPLLARRGGALVLAGPGIRDTATVYVDGFAPAARAAFAERNAMRPLGLDLVMVTADGTIVCLTRYTSFVEGQEE